MLKICTKLLQKLLYVLLGLEVGRPDMLSIRQNPVVAVVARVLPQWANGWSAEEGSAVGNETNSG